jgi:aryl-alcohol dehydrogenase-like predicted oxidoreductase
MFDRFADAGGNFIDTADTYQFGQSEQLVGEFIGSDRDNFVVATKYTLVSVANGGLSRLGNSRDSPLLLPFPENSTSNHSTSIGIFK